MRCPPMYIYKCVDIHVHTVVARASVIWARGRVGRNRGGANWSLEGSQQKAM